MANDVPPTCVLCFRETTVRTQQQQRVNIHSGAKTCRITTKRRSCAFMTVADLLARSYDNVTTAPANNNRHPAAITACRPLFYTSWPRLSRKIALLRVTAYGRTRRRTQTDWHAERFLLSYRHLSTPARWFVFLFAPLKRDGCICCFSGIQRSSSRLAHVI